MKVLAEGIQGNPAKKLEKESFSGRHPKEIPLKRPEKENFSGKQASEIPLKTQEIKVLAE